MRNVVNKPIINDPFEEPKRHYLFSRDELSKLVEGRRGAGYYFNPRNRGSRGMEYEALVPLELANAVRERVRLRREQGWTGATNVTKDLLSNRNRPRAEVARPLFFREREAAGSFLGGWGSGRPGSQGGWDVWRSTDSEYDVVAPAPFGRVKALFR